MDSMEKIIEEMRARNDYTDYCTLCDFVIEWADRLDALTKEPVVWQQIYDALYSMRLAPRHQLEQAAKEISKLFSATPAPAAASTQDLDDFLSRVQTRVIELCHMPPAWPTNERDGTDDPVESAARMICGLLDRIQQVRKEVLNWTETAERPPKNYPQTLLVLFDGYYRPGYERIDYSGDGVWSTEDIPSHWMELPDPVGGIEREAE